MVKAINIDRFPLLKIMVQNNATMQHRGPTIYFKRILKNGMVDVVDIDLIPIQDYKDTKLLCLATTVSVPYYSFLKYC